MNEVFAYLCFAQHSGNAVAKKVEKKSGSNFVKNLKHGAETTYFPKKIQRTGRFPEKLKNENGIILEFSRKISKTCGGPRPISEELFQICLSFQSDMENMTQIKNNNIQKDRAE